MVQKKQAAVVLDSETVAALTAMWGVRVHGDKAMRRWERQVWT